MAQQTKCRLYRRTNVSQIAPWWSIRETGERESAYSDTGTYQRANHYGQSELKNVLRAIDGASSAGETVDQPNPAERFKCVADCNEKRSTRISGRCNINQKRPNEYARPYSVTEQKQRSQCDPGGRPHG
jgi:hypothetical protein